MNKAVYIHIPFCNSICSYCDFCKVLYKKEWVNNYLEKLAIEVKDIYMGDKIDSIYIGGGTPSALNKNELQRLFEIINFFDLCDSYEFTFECNLEDITEELLLFLKANNVNRLSIGIESFDPLLLKIMNRNHDFKDALEKINLCKQVGFRNINVDLIYGFKDQTLKMLKQDIKKLLKLEVDHISTYDLILENNTILKNNNYTNCSEEEDAAMYEYICKKLKSKNYNHYEVSNFGVPGYESIHNLKYWNNEEYYGFGLGAAGYIDGIRYTNTRSLTDYINEEEFSKKELLTKQDIMDLEIMLGFRKLEGININSFYEKYDENIMDLYPIKPLLNSKDLILKNNRLYINPKKIYVMNEILIKLI